MSEFKKCGNGHYYQGTNCPYCPDNMGSETSAQTVQSPDTTDDGATKIFGNLDETVRMPEQPRGNDNVPTEKRPTEKKQPAYNPNLTIIPGLTEVVTDEDGNQKMRRKQGSAKRRLVGWLVSYTLDEMGTCFNLYEGKNLIGKAEDCNITVDDPAVSGKHATLLFKSNKYQLKDEFTTNGTWVNEVDIDDEVCKLNDGDIIKIGETVFKFRMSL
jgi:hypothetical protein